MQCTACNTNVTSDRVRFCPSCGNICKPLVGGSVILQPSASRSNTTKNFGSMRVGGSAIASRMAAFQQPQQDSSDQKRGNVASTTNKFNTVGRASFGGTGNRLKAFETVEENKESSKVSSAPKTPQNSPVEPQGTVPSPVSPTAKQQQQTQPKPNASSPRQRENSPLEVRKKNEQEQEHIGSSSSPMKGERIIVEEIIEEIIEEEEEEEEEEEDEGFGPCTKCKKNVVGKASLDHLGRKYHPPCFACTVCSKPIAGKYSLDGDSFRCGTCGPLKVLVSKNCSSCFTPIVNSDGYNFEGKSYHKACFVCTVCSTHLGGIKFTFEDGQLRCKSCLATQKGAFCAACGKVVDTVGVTAFVSLVYHEQCFRCCDCNRVISKKDKFLPKGDKPWCFDCAAK